MRAQEPIKPAGDTEQDGLDLFVGGRAHGYQVQSAALSHEHAVRDDAVKVDVEVEGAAEALDECHRAAATGFFSHGSRAPPVVREDRWQGHRQRPTRELRIAGEDPARPSRQREHPLPHRHARDDRIDQMRRGIVHAAGIARGTDTTSFAGNP